jgi:hypothetical protein
MQYETQEASIDLGSVSATHFSIKHACIHRMHPLQQPWGTFEKKHDAHTCLQLFRVSVRTVATA